MTEVNKKICKRCNEPKTRIEDGFYNHKDKRWKDESGLLWNGLVCPQCNKIRSKEIMERRRDEKLRKLKNG